LSIPPQCAGSLGILNFGFVVEVSAALHDIFVDPVVGVGPFDVEGILETALVIYALNSVLASQWIR
jgi:hypothetical protein